MFISYFARIALTTAIISIVCFSPASSRQWKTTPEGLAADYAAITDGRPGEVISVTWFVPPMWQPNATALIALTKKYVVLMAADRKTDKATGSFEFEDIAVLEPKDESGKALTPVARNDLPPASAGILALLESFGRQSSAFGKGAKAFLFEKGDVDPCKKGQLSVVVAGETYTWETPVPSCSRSAGQDKSADRT